MDAELNAHIQRVAAAWPELSPARIDRVIAIIQGQKQEEAA